MAGKLFNIYSGNTGGVLSTSTAKVGSFGTTSDDFYSVNFDTGRKSIWTNNIEFGRAADWGNISDIPTWIGSDGVMWANVKDKPSYATRWPSWDEVTSKPSSFTPSAHDHRRILYIDDRDTVETPTDVAGKNGIEIHFKNKSKSGITSSGTWTAIVMLDGYSDVSGGYPMELGFSMSDLSDSRPLYLRTPKSSTEWGDWRTILDSKTYTDFTVKKDGTGATGTWGISITGNAGSADKLKTARTITINGSSKPFDGTGNISWSLEDLNLPSNEHNHDTRYLKLSGGTMTGAIKRHYATASDDPFYSVTSNNLDIWVWRVMHNASAASVSTSASTGFGLKYLGAGSGNNNDLALYSDNQTGPQVEAIRIKQDGAVTFSKQISSTLATGASPFNVTSTTLNTNLNADLLDGVHANGLFTNFSNKTVSGNKVLAATIGGKELTVVIEYAGSANTATNLTNKPSLQAGTNDTNKITVTAGGKTSNEFTVPFATNSSKLDNIAASNYFKSRDYVYNSEWTGRFLWTIWDNHLWAADKRFNVTVTGTTDTNFATLFNGSFEGYITITDNTSVIHIKSNTDGAVWTSGLPYGNFYLVFYNSNAENITARVYCNYSGQGIGWHDLTVSNINKVWILANSYYQISDLEITITKPASSSSIWLSQILHQVTRSSGPSLAAVMSKYGDQKTYYNIEAAKFIGPLQGNADTATKLKTARTITINGSSKSFDGTGNISWSLAELNLPSNDHNHDAVYVKKAGDTMSGVLHLLGAQYTDTAGTGALDLSNSDIYGVNSIKFADLSDTAAEGLQWYRDATHVDSIWVKKGVIYFTPNRTWQGTGTDYTIYHSGNLTAATLLGSTAKGNTTKPIYWDGSKLVECLAYSQASVNYANTAGNADNVRWFVSGTSFDITETNKWYRIAYWKSTGEIRNSVSFYIKNNGGQGNAFWTKFSFDSDWQRAHAYWINIEGLISYVDGLCLSYDSEYIYINLHFKQTNLKHYYLYVPLNSTAPTTGNEMFTWLSGELPEMTGTVSSSYIAHGNTGFNSNAYISGAGFYKVDSSNSYVLLGGGGHKEESSLSVNYAASAGNAATADNADKLDTFHAADLFQTFTNDATNNAVKIKIGDNEKSLVVGYATKANTADSSEATEYLNNYTTSDPNTGAIKASKVKWFAYITSSSGYAGNNYGFKTTNNANGILYLGTYPGKYGHQLGFSGNGNIYHRYQNGADFPNTANGGSWEVLLTSNNYTTTTDTRYVKKAGDTMTGLLTTTSAHSHDGIKVGDTYINAINGNLILQNNSAIRFGGDSWDYNNWAGLKYVHSSKTIYLGLADGSSFTANSAQSGGKLYLPGIDNIYTGNGTNLIWHGGNDGSGSGLDADLLDGKHADEFLYRLRRGNYEVSHTVNGMIPPTILELKNAGYPVYTDPEFAEGNNSINIYNNKRNGTVTLTRETDTQGSANSSGYILKIVTDGEAQPGAGGFYQSITSRANAIFVQLFRAKIPIGYNVTTASNSMGNQYKDLFITDRAGTGKWEWYARLVYCGADGTFSVGGHVYLTGTSNTSVTWYISYCNVIDISKGNYDGLRTRLADHATSSDSATSVAWENITGKATSKTAWGQTFVDSSGNIQSISGDMTSVGQVTPDGNATRNNGTSTANWANVYTRNIISGDHLTLTSGTAKDIIFKTNAGTEYMRLTSGGLLGVGTNSPAYKLHVKGSQKIEAGSLGIYPVGGNYNDGIRLHARSSDNAWAAITFCASDNTGDTGISANSWFVGNYSGNFYITKNGSSSGTSFLCNVSNIWHIQNRISIDTTGRIYPYSTSTRRAGIYGVYDSHKIGHIWSMGTSYMISDDGLDPGNLYGLAYFHTNWSNDATYNINAANKTAIGTYAGGHQVGWFSSGVIQASIGSYIWSRNGFIKNGSNNNYVLTGGGSHKQWSETKVASTIVARTADNNIYAGYYNSDISDDESMTPTSVYCSNDKWIRKQSIGKFADNLRADEIITITKDLAVTEAWMDTGIIMNTDTFPRASGTYAIQIYSDTYGTDGYYPYYSGIMSIYTASTSGSLEDEVPLHCVGYANGGTVQDKRIYIRTVEQLNSNAKIQIAAASALSSHKYTFKFRKLI